MRGSKYNARKTVVDGVQFDSQWEAQRWGELQVMERVGFIRDLRRQVEFELQPAFKRWGKSVRAITLRVDFTYVEGGVFVAEDAKGVITKDAALKLKMFQYVYPDYQLRIAKKS